MSQSTKTTSLTTLTEALTQHGWEFTVTEREVRVPDPDSPHVRTAGHSNRVTHMPTKFVPGFAVSARNGIPGAQYSFTASFTANGKYLAQHTSGGYPFGKGQSMKDVLANIEEKSPGRIAAQRASNEAYETERKTREARAVLEAHAAAKQSLVFAEDGLSKILMTNGLDAAQARVVLQMVKEGGFGGYLNALAAVERTGKGWLPGQSWVSGTYVDGVKVSD